MINKLQRNTPINYIIILTIMLVLWLFRFIYMPTSIEIYEVNNFLFSQAPEGKLYDFLSSLLGFLFIYLTALYMAKINIDLNIIENTYQMPALFYVLLSGFYINAQRFLPSLVAGNIMFSSIVILFYSYKKNNSYSNCFDAGLLFGIASLFYIKFIIFFPLLIIALAIIKKTEWRELIIIFLGLLTPLLITSSIIFLFSDYLSFFEKIKLIFNQVFTDSKLNFPNSIAIYFILFWILIAIIYKFLIRSSQKVVSQKFQIIIILILICYTLYYVSPYSDTESITITFCPLSILLTNVISKIKRKNIFFWILLGTIIISQAVQIIFYLSIY